MNRPQHPGPASDLTTPAVRTLAASPEGQRELATLRRVLTCNKGTQGLYARWRYGINPKKTGFFPDDTLALAGLADATLYDFHLSRLRLGQSLDPSTRGYSNKARLNVKDRVQVPTIPVPQGALKNEDFKPETPSALFLHSGNKEATVLELADMELEDLLAPSVEFEQLLNWLLHLHNFKHPERPLSNILDASPAYLQSLIFSSGQIGDFLAHFKKERLSFPYAPASKEQPVTYFQKLLVAGDYTTIFEILGRVAILLCKVAGNIRVPQGSVKRYFQKEVAKYNRKFKLFLWPFFYEVVKLGNLDVNHYRFLASFHPLAVSTWLFRGSYDLRPMLTRLEIQYLCSCIEVTDFKQTALSEQKIFDWKTKRYVLDEATGRPKKEKRYRAKDNARARGYFLNYYMLHTDPGERGLLLTDYVAHLRRYYEPNLHQKAQIPDPEVAFIAEGQKLISKTEQTTWEKYGPAYQAFDEFIRDHSHLISDYEEIAKFKLWLRNNQAVEKSGLIPSIPLKPEPHELVIHIKDFHTYSDDDKLTLLRAFIGQLPSMQDVKDSFDEEERLIAEEKKSSFNSMMGGTFDMAATLAKLRAQQTNQTNQTQQPQESADAPAKPEL